MLNYQNSTAKCQHKFKQRDPTDGGVVGKIFLCHPAKNGRAGYPGRPGGEIINPDIEILNPGRPKASRVNNIESPK
jgi:hypothetical protein